MPITATITRDANRVPVQSNEAFITTSTIGFTGAEGSGAVGTRPIFTVDGTVLVTVFAVCSENLASAGGGTIELGIEGNTAALIGQTTATDIDANEIWIDNAPATVEALPAGKILTAGSNITETVGTGDITDGTLTYYCLWRPLSADGNVTA